MAPADKPPEGHDASRREFFRTFSRQTVQSAGALAGAASEIRRTGLAAAREIFDPTAEALAPVTPVPAAQPAEASATADWTFRSPYRVVDDELVVLDQRELPGRVTTITVCEPAEVASAMRMGVVTAGPVLAELGAYALALAARAAPDRSLESRRQIMRASTSTLRGARRDIQALSSAMDRMDALHDRLLDEGGDPTHASRTLLAEADAIATAATVGHARIGRHAAALFGPPGEAPLQLLMHGDAGPLSCGTIGMGTALIAELAGAGHAIHVWVTEGGPSGEGSRISSLQLARNDVAHTVIPDSAVGWLFANRAIDAVILRGDRICANGDTGAIIGSLAAARFAADAGVPVHVLASVASFDREAASGGDIQSRRGSTAEVLAQRRTAAGVDRRAMFGARLNPTVDVIPASLVAAFVTESSDREASG